MDYLLSEDRYQFIKETDLEYYFYIEDPKEVAELVGEEKTELIKGKDRSEGNDICTITFKQNIEKGVSENVKNTDLSDYNLIITNKEYYPVTIFNDIQTFISVDGSSRFFNID